MIDFRTRVVLLIFGCSMMLAACSGGGSTILTPPPATPTATATSTSTPTAAPHATATPTAIPTASPTATPTAIPSATPTAAPTTTPTAIPTATPVPTATPAPTATPTPGPSPLSLSPNSVQFTSIGATSQITIDGPSGTDYGNMTVSSSNTSVATAALQGNGSQFLVTSTGVGSATITVVPSDGSAGPAYLTVQVETASIQPQSRKNANKGVQR